MRNERPIPLILALADASATLDLVGGKGASLARLAAAGLPVPPGFHLSTAAYRRFVAENHLQERILAAVAAVSAEQPATLVGDRRGSAGPVVCRPAGDLSQRPRRSWSGRCGETLLGLALDGAGN